MPGITSVLSGFQLIYLDLRITFGAWKIIQCYYAVYASIAALVRCVRNDAERIGHGQTLNIYAHEILMKENFKSYSPTPANNFLDQQGNLENDELLRKWKWGETHSIPVMVKCL